MPTRPSAPESALRFASLLLLLLALAMQGVSSWHQGAFWLDEAGSVSMARLPLPVLWDYLRYDSFPIGHFLIFKVWLSLLGFLDVQTAMRLLGFLVGSATVLVFWFLSRRLTGDYPLFGFALFGLTPLIVRYIGTARPYGLSALFLLLTAYFALSMLQGKATRATYWAGALSALVTAQLHYLNVLGLIVISLAVLLAAPDNKVRQRITPFLCAVVLSFLSLLIYLPSLRFAAREWAFMLNSADSSLLPIWIQFVLLAFPFEPLLPLIWLIVTSAALFGFFYLLRNPRLSPEQRQSFYFAATLGLCAPVFWIGFVFLGKTKVSMWYFISPLMLMCLGTDAILSLARATFTFKARNLTSALLFPLALALGVLQSNAASQVLFKPMSGMDAAARIVESAAKQGDMVLVTPWLWSLSFSFYYQGQVPLTRVPAIEHPQFMRWDLARQLAESRDPIPGLLEKIQSTLQKGHRVFVVTRAHYFDKLPYEVVPPHKVDLEEWSIHRYTRSWGVRVDRFLEKHPAQRRDLISPSRSGYGFEEPSVRVYSGWQGTP